MGWSTIITDEERCAGEQGFYFFQRRALEDEVRNWPPNGTDSLTVAAR
jgi:hypothetical protein